MQSPPPFFFAQLAVKTDILNKNSGIILRATLFSSVLFLTATFLRKGLSVKTVDYGFQKAPSHKEKRPFSKLVG